ncbi:MAG: serine acetyltransferase [Verrucomicrobiae bacterium]|nr:serine acetyltransferase [Verrucomicrobiae bacterium]
MFELLRADYARYRPSGFRARLYLWLFNFDWHQVIAYRWCSFLNRHRWRTAARFFGYGARIFFSSDISWKAKVGPGFYISHGVNIVIGSGARIGANCTILNGVTLGQRRRIEDLKGEAGEDGYPVLGDDIYLGTGCKILGPVCIDDHVTVGANSVVTKDVRSNVIVAGVPARIIRDKEATQRINPRDEQVR